MVVVGATGWVGRHVVHQARVLGRSGVAVSRRGEAVEGWPGAPLAQLADHVGPGTTVVNAAGAMVGDDGELEAANVDLVRRLGETCLGAGARLVTLGSAAEYGPPAAPQLDEQHPTHPTSPYGRSKLAATHLVDDLRERGLTASVLRVFNLVGGDRLGTDPVSDFAAAVRALPVQGGVVHPFDSSLVRDLMTVDRAARLVLRLAERDDLPAVLNVCSGVGTRFRDLIEAMAAVRGVPVTVQDVRPGGISRVVGDPTRLVALLGPVPAEPVEVLAAAALATG